MPIDLSVFLEAVQPLEVPFANDVIKCEIYTAGISRLTKEQRVPILAIDEIDATESMSADYAKAVDGTRLALPLLVKSWDLLWKGQPLPIEDMNATDSVEKAGVLTDVYRYTLPDDLIFAVRGAIREAVEQGPTKEVESPSTSEPKANASETTAGE